MSAAMPGASATIRVALRYANRSSHRDAAFKSGLRIAPMAIGTAGQRSRTSNTIGHFARHDAYTAGNAIVSGVLVANTTSPRNSAALRAARHANVRNALMRAP